MKKLLLFTAIISMFHFATKAQDHNTIKATAQYPGLSVSDKPNIITFLKDMNLDTISIAPKKDYAYYMQKSKNQRTAGLVLLGTGLVTSGLGLLIATGSNANFDNTQAGVTIMGIGALSGIVSIPFMIMAHANRSKAMILLSNQKTGQGIPSGSQNITGLGISVSIGK